MKRTSAFSAVRGGDALFPNDFVEAVLYLLQYAAVWVRLAAGGGRHIIVFISCSSWDRRGRDDHNDDDQRESVCRQQVRQVIIAPPLIVCNCWFAGESSKRLVLSCHITYYSDWVTV